MIYNSFVVLYMFYAFNLRIMARLGLLVVVFVLIAQTIAPAQTKLFFETDIHDFGLVKEGEIASFDFQFENNGDDTVRLANVKPSCGCTSPFWTKDPIAPGESGNIKVNYNSRGRLGEFLKNITVTILDDPETQILRIKGVVDKMADSVATKADLEASPVLVLNKTAHFFGKIEQNKPVTYKFKVTNAGKSPLEITGVKAGCHCIKQTKTWTSLAPGESGSLEITYTPHVLGASVENVFIYSNDLNDRRKQVTIQSEVVKSLVTNSIMQQNTGFGF